jgi:hypothetical protein
VTEAAVGLDVAFDPVQQRRGPCVLGDGGAPGPPGHRVEQLELLGRRAALFRGRCCLDGFACGVADAVLAGLLVERVGGIVEQPLQDVRCRRGRRAALAQQRLAVNLQRAQECRRR